jgi:hypothetical protein
MGWFAIDDGEVGVSYSDIGIEWTGTMGMLLVDSSQTIRQLIIFGVLVIGRVYFLIPKFNGYTGDH